MKRYKEISDIYRGSEMAFFLIEGKKDRNINRYIRGHKKNIENYLAKRGVRYTAFNILSTTLFGSRSLRSLILRQRPTARREELDILEKELKGVHKEGHSLLLYVCGTGKTDEGKYYADIIAENELWKKEEYNTALYHFLDAVIHFTIGQQNNIACESAVRYRFANDDEPATDNSEFLGYDLLASSICPADSSTISPLRFDSKYNISLPLYPQITIKLEPLQKSVYILFLRHPEGIVLKEIEEYKEELKRIYNSVSGRRNPTVVNRTLKALTDPTDNLIHKTLSVIRKRFINKLNYSIAQNYIPAHNRGRAHNIPLDCNLVEIPEI